MNILVLLSLVGFFLGVAGFLVSPNGWSLIGIIFGAIGAAFNWRRW